MSVPAYEISAQDREFFEKYFESRERNEQKESILAWMGKHKVLSTLGVGALLAAGVYFTPGAAEWVGVQLKALSARASGAVAKWLQSLGNFLWKNFVPKHVQDAVDLWNKFRGIGGKAFEGAAAGAKGIVEDAKVIAGNPEAAAKGFLKGGWDAFKNIAEKGGETIGKGINFLSGKK